MTDFTPWSALAGGVLIGLAATLLMASIGRISGISGILDDVVTGRKDGMPWRLAFLTGLIISPFGFALAQGSITGALPSTDFVAHGLWLALGGFLIGFGARLGNGCTSGHGVCGIARFSPRSIIATSIFVAGGAVTVFLVRHVFPGVVS